MTTRRGRNSQLAEQTVREAKAFTEKEALDNKLIELIAPDEQQLLKQLDGREITRWDGRKQVLSVRIDAEAVKAGDIEMLQDLVMAAINGAGHKVDEAMQSTMGGMLGGMGIPGI